VDADLEASLGCGAGSRLELVERQQEEAPVRRVVAVRRVQGRAARA
jgi:hypothetical protein